MHCISLLSLPAVGTNCPSCVDVPLNIQSFWTGSFSFYIVHLISANIVRLYNLLISIRFNSSWPYNIDVWRSNRSRRWYSLAVQVCVCGQFGNTIVVGITADITGNCNVTQTILSSSVPENVSIGETKYQKCRRGWGPNPWPLALL